MRAEIEYVTYIFYENGYDQKTLQKIFNNFEKKTHSTNNNNDNNNNNNNTTKESK